MKNNIILSVVIAILLSSTCYAQTIKFDIDELLKPPLDFTTFLTGKGKPGVWIVVKDESAPSKPNALAQIDMDETGYRFPVCIYDTIVVKNMDLSVRFKPLKGKIDQGAGIVWRYQDKNNYYVVRANALENNVVLYKIEKGERTDIDPVGSGLFVYGKDVEVTNGEWQSLKVTVKENLFMVYLNGQKLFEVEDKTFTKAGKIGLWTKADSYTYFDDLSVQVIK